ncbi:MAG: DUF948 domain-containing protein [Nitrospiraceae bacterium]|nr:MAG: DUF948 domain-containing protein [Nitrospiraceae bacterium]
MPETNFLWGIIAGAVIVLTAFLVPAVLQITKTAKAAENLIRTTQESLTPLIVKLHETVDKTNQIASQLNESIGNVQKLTKAAGETGAVLSDVNDLLRKAGMFFSVTTSSFGSGIKTALGVLAQGLIKKGG